MATAMVENNEPVAEEGERKTRVKLHPENVYYFPPTALLDDIQANKIVREDETQVDMYRSYTILKSLGEGKEPEKCGYAFGKTENEALGRFVEAKGYSAEVTFDRPRGAPKGPRVDQNVVNSMKKVWEMKNGAGRPVVLEFCCESKQYTNFFEFTAQELEVIKNYSATEE